MDIYNHARHYRRIKMAVYQVRKRASSAQELPQNTVVYPFSLNARIQPAKMHAHYEYEYRENNEEPAVKRALAEGRSPGREEQERQDKACGIQVFVRDAPEDLHTSMKEGMRDNSCRDGIRNCRFFIPGFRIDPEISRAPGTFPEQPSIRIRCYQ